MSARICEGVAMIWFVLFIEKAAYISDGVIYIDRSYFLINKNIDTITDAFSTNTKA